MQGELSSMPCDEFAAQLASKSSVPGGGGAAAYAGALGIALGQMACNLTIGKARYADVEDDIIRVNDEAEGIRKRLVELVDEDARAFEPLARAYSIPKDDPLRAEVLAEATETAMACPLEMMRLCCRAIELLEVVQQKGSKMLASDVGCGAALCRGALEAAAMNVLVNSHSLEGSDTAKCAEEECMRMLDAYVPRAASIATATIDSLKGE